MPLPLALLVVQNDRLCRLRHPAYNELRVEAICLGLTLHLRAEEILPHQRQKVDFAAQCGERLGNVVADASNGRLYAKKRITHWRIFNGERINCHRGFDICVSANQNFLHKTPNFW